MKNLKQFSRALLEDGGATFNLVSGEHDFKGYAYSIFGNEKIHDNVSVLAEVEQAVKTFVGEKGVELYSVHNHLGGWFEEGKLFLDITNVTSDLRNAIEQGIRNGQKAIHDFQSNKPHKPSTIQSLFNCDLPDAKCKYFYPANFFDAECGLGKQFAYHIDDAKAKMANNTLWNSMPSVGFPTLTMKNMCIVAETGVRVRYDASEQIESEIELTDIGEHNEDGNHCMTERLSFLHVHKAGGSSLHSAFNYIAANAHADLVRHKFFTPRNRPGGTYEMTPRQEEMRTFTLDSLAEATRYPDEKFTIHQHTIFAAVRDPTERFISSIGQALGASGSGGNKIGGVLLKECVKTTSHAALSCLAKYVRDHGFWIELHFTPQVVDIAFTTMYQDVPVAIFPMKPHLTTVLTYFGRGDVKARDGSQKNYRSDPILTNMTVADYDDETLEIVCHLYEIDVRMQRSLGMEVPRCDPFIPHEYDFQF